MSLLSKILILSIFITLAHCPSTPSTDESQTRYGPNNTTNLLLFNENVKQAHTGLLPDEKTETCSGDLQDAPSYVPKPEPNITSSKLNQISAKGTPSLRGYNSFLVIFVKYLSLEHSDNGDQSKKQFRSDQFLCAGTILNRRWVLTKAGPIAYYPVDSYFMMAKNSINLPLIRTKLSIDDVIEVHYVAVHPEYQQGKPDKYDLAMVRTLTSMKYTFELRSVNFGYNQKISLDNCKLVMWSLNGTKIDASLVRAEMNFAVAPSTTRRRRQGNNMVPSNVQGSGTDLSHLKNQNPTALQNKENFYDLTQKQANTPLAPCALNSGAPLMCDSFFAGVYVGYDGTVNCDDVNKSPFNVIRTMRSQKDDTIKWIEEITSTVMGDSKKFDLAEFEQQFRVCGKGMKNLNTIGSFLLTLLLLSDLLIRHY